LTNTTLASMLGDAGGLLAAQHPPLSRIVGASLTSMPVLALNPVLAGNTPQTDASKYPNNDPTYACWPTTGKLCSSGSVCCANHCGTFDAASRVRRAGRRQASCIGPHKGAKAKQRGLSRALPLGVRAPRIAWRGRWAGPWSWVGATGSAPILDV
jgi:hypothetical protein